MPGAGTDHTRITTRLMYTHRSPIIIRPFPTRITDIGPIRITTAIIGRTAGAGKEEQR
jgi:hypothetical protein